MRYPQILVCEHDGRLAEVLRRQMEAVLWQQGDRPGWLLREPRLPQSCLRLLAQGGPAVLVIKMGRDLPRELALLDRVTEQMPDTKVVLVGDDADPVLASLAWDLGASYVLMPPQPRDLLAEVVSGLMNAAIGQRRLATGQK